jgi:hypothetical protein
MPTPSLGEFPDLGRSLAGREVVSTRTLLTSCAAALAASCARTPAGPFDAFIAHVVAHDVQQLEARLARLPSCEERSGTVSVREALDAPTRAGPRRIRGRFGWARACTEMGCNYGCCNHCGGSLELSSGARQPWLILHPADGAFGPLVAGGWDCSGSALERRLESVEVIITGKVRPIAECRDHDGGYPAFIFAGPEEHELVYDSVCVVRGRF